MRVLLLEDDPTLRRAIERHLRSGGAEVLSTDSVERARAELAARPAAHEVFLADLWLPDGNGLEALEGLSGPNSMPATIVMTGEATVETAVGALRVGAVDYLLKPFSMDALDAALGRAVGAASQRRDEPESASSSEERAAARAWRARHAPALLGESAPLLAVFSVLSRVATADCSLLLVGETGTGKELVARALHAASGRGAHPFVPVNCAAVPEQFIESELFGHAKGAFTGAQSRRIGRFQEAHRGTLFLDEIGEMPLAPQAKLLRVLQEKELRPLGDSKSVRVDVRVIAATHRDLDALVQSRAFREDLLYRLDVVRVELPPLRARPGDVPLLVEAFVDATSRRRGVGVLGVEADALEALVAYPWPGNVRELQNVVERMVLLRGEGRLRLEDVPPKVRGARGRGPREPAGAEPAFVLPADGIDLKSAIARFEASLIRQALERAAGNRTRAASLLGLNRTTLVERLRKAEQPSAPGGVVDGDDEG